MRLLTVFAFMQTMNYVVWVALMPRVAPDASAAFEARLPWATGPRLWAAGFVAAALFAVLFGLDFAQGRTVYAALSSYTAYLELPVLLAMLVGGASLSASRPAEDEGETASESGVLPFSSAPSWPSAVAAAASAGRRRVASGRPATGCPAAVAPDPEVGA